VPALRPWLEYLPLRMNFEGLKSGFRRAREAAGMPHVHYHDLRHSCATILLSLGTPLDVVRDILGHTTIKTTERYAHALVDRQRQARGSVRWRIYTNRVHQRCEASRDASESA
jgi:integrase